MMALLNELQSITNREFWEVSERGTNFTFISPEQKAQLPVFFSWFKNFDKPEESQQILQDSKPQQEEVQHNKKEPPAPPPPTNETSTKTRPSNQNKPRSHEL
jgi:hypothetical protein